MEKVFSIYSIKTRFLEHDDQCRRKTVSVARGDQGAENSGT
jgi:hypothetical protein